MNHFKILHTQVQNLASNTGLLISNRTKNICILPLQTIQLLRDLSGFASLREHAQSMSRANNIMVNRDISHPGGAETWQNLLNDLAQKGFLRSEKDVRQQIARIASSKSTRQSTGTAIRRIGIPTANRPDCLKRAIETFSRQTRRHGRKVGFIVMDDSRKEAAR